jgi:hypothetical protein
MANFDVNSIENTKLSKWINLLVQPLEAKAQNFQNQTKRNQYLFMIIASLITGTHENFLNIIQKVHDKHLNQNNQRPNIQVKQLRKFKASVAQPEQEVEPKVDEFGIPFIFSDVLDPKDKIKVAELTNFEWLERNDWQNRITSLNNLDVAKALEEERLKPKPRPGSRNKNVPAQSKPKEKKLKCSYHRDDKCPSEAAHMKLGKCFDNQFNYLITLATECPAANNPKIALWLDALSRIDESSCVIMKSIRNDHIMLLLGYILHNEIKGPFEMEPISPLEPIGDTIATYNATTNDKKQKSASKSVTLNPVSDTIEAFMDTVPKIEEGAFALLTITGNFFNQ